MVSDVVAQLAELLGGRRIGLEKPLTQSERAERQADDARGTSTRELGDLQTSSPEIEKQPIRSRKPPDRPREAVARFRGTSHDLDSHAEFALQSPGKEGAVARVAHGRRGNR